MGVVNVCCDLWFLIEDKFWNDFDFWFWIWFWMKDYSVMMLVEILECGWENENGLKAVVWCDMSFKGWFEGG